MTRRPTNPHEHNDTVPGKKDLETTSSDTLLVAADALRAWGAESDAERIEMWVAQHNIAQQATQYNPLTQ